MSEQELENLMIEVTGMLSNGWILKRSHNYLRLVHPERNYRIFVSDKGHLRFMASYTEAVRYDHDLPKFPEANVDPKRGVTAVFATIEKCIISFADETVKEWDKQYQREEAFGNAVAANQKKIIEASGNKAKVKSAESMQFNGKHVYAEFRVYDNTVRIDRVDGVPIDKFIQFIESLSQE